MFQLANFISYWINYVGINYLHILFYVRVLFRFRISVHYCLCLLD